jgi:hypothetical protein
MSLFDKMIGRAEASTSSTLGVERFLLEGEQIVTVFKFMRDEVVITTLGLFHVDVQGITGAKKEYRCFPMKGLKYVSYESAGFGDFDADIKIGVDGNSGLVNGVPANVPISFKIPRAQSSDGERFLKLIRQALHAAH